jgi:hypothetical protein
MRRKKVSNCERPLLLGLRESPAICRMFFFYFRAAPNKVFVLFREIGGLVGLGRRSRPEDCGRVSALAIRIRKISPGFIAAIAVD